MSDSAVLSIAPQIAKHFVNAEVRHFNASERASLSKAVGRRRPDARRLRPDLTAEKYVKSM